LYSTNVSWEIKKRSQPVLLTERSEVRPFMLTERSEVSLLRLFRDQPTPLTERSEVESPWLELSVAVDVRAGLKEHVMLVKVRW